LIGIKKEGKGMLIFGLTMLVILLVGAMKVSEQLVAKGSMEASIHFEGLEMLLSD
jgi:hypothetical protein